MLIEEGLVATRGLSMNCGSTICFDPAEGYAKRLNKLIDEIVARKMEAYQIGKACKIQKPEQQERKATKRL